MAINETGNMNSSKNLWYGLLSKREGAIRKIANQIIITIEKEFDEMHSQNPNESTLIFYVLINEKKL